MNHLNLGKLLRDARRKLRSGSFDVLADGRIHLQQQGALLGGSFRARYAEPGCDDFGAPVISHNRVVGQGLIKLLNLLGGHASSAPLFIAPFIDNVEPQANWTGANFDANANEFTAYTAATRLPWTTVPVASVPTLTNQAALLAATLTFNAGGPYTIRGAALLEASAKEAVTGALIVASRFPDDLTGMMGGGKLALEYSLVAMDEADAT
ncbi:MAG TPA: hypothetical protein VGE09_06240 [Pseudoxanthomonas sp.]